jgi:hypothetical protein
LIVSFRMEGMIHEGVSLYFNPEVHFKTLLRR